MAQLVRLAFIFLCTARAEWPLASSVQSGSHDSVPNSQTWSIVRWARLEAKSGLVQLFDPSRTLFRSAHDARTQETKRALLGASKWGLFFHGEVSDAVYGDYSLGAEFSCQNKEALHEEPVFLINLLTWQIGHLLVDVLEPLFYASQDHNRDSLLIFHVATPEEADVLPRKIAATIDADTPFSLLRLFSKGPVLSRSHLQDSLCISELHVDLDLSQTYYGAGSDFGDLKDHPPLLKSQLRTRYARFRDFLHTYMHTRLNIRHELRNAVIIERTESRRLLNFDQVVHVFAEYTPRQLVARLEDMNFSAQLELFASTAVFVAQYGTAAHNVVFLPPGAVLLLIAQPGWCDYSWPYANQALLSNVSVVIQCTPSDNYRRMRWAHRASRQGPWIHKDADFTVDIPSFKKAMKQALQLVGSAKPERILLRTNELQPVRCDCHGPPLPTPRVHISDIRIEAVQPGDSSTVKISLVPEIILSHNNAEWLHRIDRGELRLCVLAAGIETCFSAEEFNEFSTLDIAAPLNETLQLKLALHSIQDDDSRQEIPESETYFAVNADGEFKGLGVSTVTHRPLLAGLSRNVSRVPLFDARNFRQCEAIRIEVLQPPAELCARLDIDVELQGRIAAACRDLGLSDDDCFVLLNAATENARLLLQTQHLPSIQFRPTASNPFVFLHHEKTAGSTIRAAVARVAKRLEVPFYVPCYDADAMYREDRRCYSFDLANASTLNGGDRNEIAVLAGHFQWNVWRDLPAFNSNLMSTAIKSTTTTTTRGRRKASSPPCLSIVRHPVDRAISLYYERVYSRDFDDLGGRRLNDLSHDDLAFLLRAFKGSAFSMYRDEGFCDTHCMMLLELNVYKGRTPAQVEAARLGDDRSKFAALELPLDTSLAISRLEECVVGLQEDWSGTLRAIEYWFPWMAKEFETSRRTKLNVGHRFEDRHSLRSELVQLIENCNQCDMQLYEAAVHRHAQQLATLAHFDSS